MVNRASAAGFPFCSVAPDFAACFAVSGESFFLARNFGCNSQALFPGSHFQRACEFSHAVGLRAEQR
jgi:hypothetical protein